MLRSVDVYGDSAVSHRHLDAVRRYGTDDMRFARGCTHDIMSLKYIYPDLYSFYFLPKYLHVQPSRSPENARGLGTASKVVLKKKFFVREDLI